MSTLQESILDAINVLAENSIRNAPGTITIDCVVSKIVNPGLGEYEVTYLGNTLSVYASNPNIEFNIGDKVYVLVPEGDFSKQKIIISASTPSTITYDTSELNNYMQVSDNLFIDKGEINLCTYSNEVKGIFNEGDNGKFNVIFPKYLKDYNTFAFSAKIKTSIPIEQQVNGNYGLILQLPFYALDSEGKKVDLWKSYVLDINNISGNPYRLTEWSNQTIFIQIGSEELYDIDRQPQLTAFVENFAQKEGKPNDIFIKDISFTVYDVLTQENQTGYYLHLAASEGNYFFLDADEETKVLTPTLKINGRNINLNSSVGTTTDTYKCYWFKEDASIKANNEFYSSIGGAGWKTLNERKNVIANEDGSKSFDLVTNQYSYSISRKEILTSARFKCVIVIVKKNSDGTTLSTPISSIIKLENLKAGVSMSIESKTGSNSYIKNIGKVNLISNIISKEINYFDSYSNYIITYEWNRYDKNGVYVDNNFYTVEFNSDKEEDNVHKITQEISFETNLIEDVNTFMCSAYINYIDNGINKKVLLGTESILINTNGTASYVLMIQNGDVLYKYDTDGDSPMDEDYDGPLDSRVDMIKPLTYTIYKADGSELTESEYAYCKAEWKVPKNSLLIPNDKNDFDENFYISNTIGRQEFVYKLASTYNYKKTDNTITLKVTFGDIELTADAPIKIVKEGDNGTNNSNYSAVITHFGSTYGERSDDIYQKFQAIYVAEQDSWYYHNLKYRINKQEELKPMASSSENGSQPLEVVVYKSGQIVSTQDYQVEWSMFDSDATNPCMDIVTGKTNIQCKIAPFFNWTEENNVYVNIVQAKITIINELENNTNSPTELYAYYPIEIVRVDKYDYIKRNIDGIEFFVVPTCINGFSSVLYASDGTNPQYNSSEPFTCVDAVFNEAGDYDSYEWYSSDNLTSIIVKDDKNKEIANQMNFRPRAKYDSSNTKNYVSAKLTYSLENKNKIQSLIDEQNKIYNNNIELNENSIEEEEHLKAFLEKCNFDTLREYVSINTSEFLSKRVKIYNALEELRERLQAIINYEKDMNNKYINIKELNEKCKKTLNRIDYIIHYIIKVENQDDNLVIDEFTLDTIDIEFLYNTMENKENSTSLPKEIVYYPISTKTILENYIEDFNKCLNTVYEKSRIQYIAILFQSVESFNNIVNFYTQLSIDDNLNWLKNHTLEEKQKKQYNDLQEYLSAIKHSLTANLDKVIITQSDILNTINRSIEIISLYGQYGTNLINQAKLNEFEMRRKSYQENAAAALKEIEKLNLSLTENEYSIIYIRPIVMTFNRYELSAITGWDGNKLYTGTGNTGDYLYAPQVGAGKKEGNGSFTGIVIGNRRGVNNEEKIGLFGFYQGIETIKLDAEFGSATFGESGKGQIIIEPGNKDNEAIIYGGNYVEGESGLIINLTQPFIKFGSGNFVVNANGHITAKGGGSIAGWKITNTQLHSDVTETNGRITLDTGTIKDGVTTYGIYSHSHNTLNSKTTGFYLSQDGLSIGNSIRISSDKSGSIEIGRLSSKKHWIISGDSDNSYIGYGSVGSSDSVYIGTDKISLGAKFSVDNQGKVTAKNIIANETGSIGGWEIVSSALRKKNNKGIGIIIKSNGNIEGGTFDNDWELNKEEDYWEIKRNGSVEFNKGKIGGWVIGKNYLKSNNSLTLNSDGSIEANTWNINANGKATFKDIEITSAADNTTTSTIGGIKVLSGGGLESENYNASKKEGYQIGKDGGATFYNITAKGGSLGDLTLDGNLAMKNANGKITFGSSAANSISYNTDKGIFIKGNMISIDSSGGTGTFLAGPTTIYSLTAIGSITIRAANGEKRTELTQEQLAKLIALI